MRRAFSPALGLVAQQSKPVAATTACSRYELPSAVAPNSLAADSARRGVSSAAAAIRLLSLARLSKRGDRALRLRVQDLEQIGAIKEAQRRVALTSTHTHTHSQAARLRESEGLNSRERRSKANARECKCECVRAKFMCDLFAT